VSVTVQVDGLYNVVAASASCADVGAALASDSVFLTGEGYAAGQAFTCSQDPVSGSSGTYTYQGFGIVVSSVTGGGGDAVFPAVGDVRTGVTFGPTGADYTGTLDADSFDWAHFDTAAAGEAFAAGFVLIGSCAVIGKAIGAILGVIRR